MITCVAWLFAGLAAVLWQQPGPSRGQRRPRAPANRDALLAPAAGIGAAAAAIVLVGLPMGVLAAGVVGPASASAVEWLRRHPRSAPPDPRLPLCLDLVSAVLHSGRPLTIALECAAPASGRATEAALTRLARLLALGADPGEAWRTCAPRRSALEPVAAVAVRSQASGLKLADAFERLAADLRAERAAAAAARANRAGIHAMGPLAACFLPSFVCLGIVPLVVGVAAAATGTLR